MNNCNFTGRITGDPELKETQSGIKVVSFSMAVKRPHVRDTTDFINCVAWRQNAEYLAMYAKKGNMVGVSGSLTSRQYEDRDGNKRTAFEITSDAVELLESRASSQASQNPAQAENNAVSGYSESSAPSFSTAPAPKFETISKDEDLPF
jgi:single-strand DNA-binding protein